MYRLKAVAGLMGVFLSLALNAQIFINTGNPDLDKYKKADSNAVIWNGTGSVPIPPNIPAEPPHSNQASHKSNTNNAASTSPSSGSENQGSSFSESRRKIKTGNGSNSGSTKTSSSNNYHVDSYPMAKSSSSSNGIPDYPPNALPGHCYSKCRVPDAYNTVEEQVIDKPASVDVQRIPPRFEMVYDTVVDVPESVRTITIPARYETVMEDHMVTPATQKWVKTGVSKNCFSSNPKDCEVWSLQDVPAVYEKIPRQVLVAPESVQQETIPAVTRVVQRNKMVEPSREIRTSYPATYKTITKKVLVRRGGEYEWKEVLCDQNITSDKISQIQQALTAQGYNPGPATGDLNDATKSALIKYQQDMGLPSGNLNMETLQALGLGQ